MENAVEKKSFEFAVGVVRFTRELKKEGYEHGLLNQLLRSGTSIGANVSEAQHGQSKKDFVSKMSIALKEAEETRYWLKVLDSAEDCQSDKFSKHLKTTDELIRLLVTIIKSSKQSL